MHTQFSEVKYFGEVGTLYPYDVRYDQADRACCNPLPDGRVQFRLRAEPALTAATLVYNDGQVKGAPMTPTLTHCAEGRFLYWQTTIRPARPQLRYSFAFKNAHGQPVYYCRHGVDHAVEPLDRWRLDLDHCAPFETPQWMHGALVYQIFPERFANGDPDNDPPDTVPWGSPPHWFEFQGGDLAGILERLDDLQDLGVEVLYLNPIFASPSTHKYDTVDYYHVDPAFGGNDALRALVKALHARGMRVILDASFNHCHPRFFAFQDVVQRGAASPYVDWFTFYEFPVVLYYRPAQLEGYWQAWIEWIEWIERVPDWLGLPLQALPPEDADGPAFAPTYEAWYGVPNMPKLNQMNPETRRYFLDVSAYWLREFQIDGWRMDVARHVEPDFWRDFRRVAKATRPDCYLLCEIWGDTSPWLQGEQFDATMNYFLRDLALGYFARQTMDTATFVDGLLRMLSLYPPQVTAVTYNLISSHDTERFLTMCGGDLTRFKLATLLQLTLPGAPGIYYGNEIGMAGGHDPECRRAFPWHQPERWHRNVRTLVKSLAHLRREYPALRHGNFFLIWQDQAAFAFLRRHQGQQVLVLINRGEKLDKVTLPIAGSRERKKGQVRGTVLWGDVHVAVDEKTIILSDLAAESGAVILL